MSKIINLTEEIPPSELDEFAKKIRTIAFTLGLTMHDFNQLGGLSKSVLRAIWEGRMRHKEYRYNAERVWKGLREKATGLPDDVVLKEGEKVHRRPKQAIAALALLGDDDKAFVELARTSSEHRKKIIVPSDRQARPLVAEVESLATLDRRHGENTQNGLGMSRQAPGFVLDYQPSKVPANLRPHVGFVGREDELKQLAERLLPNCVVPVCGGPNIGKAALVAQSLSRPETMQAFRKVESNGPSPVALLFLDIRNAFGLYQVLRRLLLALGVSKHSILSDEEIAAQDKEIRGEVFYDTIPSLIGYQLPFFIIKGADQVPEDSRGDLITLLSLDTLQYGTAILINTDPAFPDSLKASLKRTFKPPVAVGSLNPIDATELVSRIIGDRDIAQQAIAKLAAGSEELLSPKTLRDGAERFQAMRTSGGQVISDDFADSVLEIAATQVNDVLQKLGCPCADISNPAVTPLLIMAVLSRLPVTIADVSSAGLICEYMEKLTGARWFEEADGRFTLPNVARDTFRHLISGLLSTSEASTSRAAGILSSGIRELCGVILAKVEGDEALLEIQQCIEEALSWCESAALPVGHPIRAVLETMLLPLVADDVVFPFSNEELPALHHQIDSNRSFAEALASLVLTTRSNASDQESVVLAWEIAATSFLRFPNWTTHHLRVLDFSIFMRSGNRSISRRVLGPRSRIAQELKEKLTLNDHSDFPFRMAAATWLANTADIAMAVEDNQDHARHLLFDADEIVQSTAIQTDRIAICAQHSLCSRIARLRACIATTAKERRSLFERSAAAAEDSLLLSTSFTFVARSYLRAVGRVIEVIPEKNLRQDWLIRAEQRIESTAGVAFGQWPSSVQAQFIALARDETERCSEPTQRLQNLTVLNAKVRAAWEGARLLAKNGDGRSILVIGRVIRSMMLMHHAPGDFIEEEASRRQALEVAKFALKYAPSRAAWRFRLSLVELQRNSFSGTQWDLDCNEFKTPEIQEIVRECRRWLALQPRPSAGIGELDLFCQRLIWRMEGSVLRMAKNQVAAAEMNSSPGNRNRKRAYLEIQKIDDIARGRNSYLANIERTNGTFVKLEASKIQNEAQRLYAHAIVQGDGNFDSNQILLLFEKAEQRFEDSNYLRAEAARFFRRIWSYGEAVKRYESILERSRDSKLRFEVASELVETLLTAALHSPTIELPDGSLWTKKNILDRAHDLLTGDLSSQMESSDLVILRDLVGIERGESLNWLKVEEAYNKLMSGPGRYLNTVSENIQELRHSGTTILAHTEDAVLNNFTHVEALRGLGRLFLRRSELGLSADKLLDLERAYGCFDACRMLEKSNLGKELPITTFCLARSVVEASDLTGLSTPFQVQNADQGYKSLLDLAAAKSESALSRTVGMFHICMKDLKLAAQRLNSKLQRGERLD